MCAKREARHLAAAGQPGWGQDSPGSAGPWGAPALERRSAPHDALRSIYGSLPVPLVCLAADRTVTFINPAASDLLGYEVGELERMPSWLLCGSGHDANLLVPDAGQPRVPGVDGASTTPLSLKRKDGSEFGAEVTTFWLTSDESAARAPVRAPPAGDAARSPSVSVSALLVRDVAGEERAAGASGPAPAERVSGRDDTRLRLSRELNDGPVQDVIALVHRLHAAKRELQHLPPAARRAVIPLFDEMGITLARVATDLRSAVRGLRPDEVEQHGLVAALRPLLERQRGAAPAPKFELRSNVGVGARFPKHVESCLYRVAQEAAANTVRHAQASALRLTLTSQDERVELLLEDDGRGFEVPSPLASLVAERRYGLAGLAELVRSACGQLEVRSSPGQGASVRASVPVERRSQPRDR